MLQENIIGQNEVIDILTQSIKRYTCGFYGKNRPIVSMMFIGPTGTGKTEVVNLLGEHYFGSRNNIICQFIFDTIIRFMITMRTI